MSGNTLSLSASQFNFMPVYAALGKGAGSSAVYSSFFDGHECAVKCLTVSTKLFSPRYSTAKRELYLESATLAAHAHPNIISLLRPCDKGTLVPPSGVPFKAHYCILEMLSGGELFAYAEVKPLSEDEMRFYALQVLSALSYLHKKGLAHGDIKGENILLTQSLETAKLIDFGFVSSCGTVDPQEVARGTRQYMAPEQHGLFPYDPAKADIFSLGATMFALVLGCHPCSDRCVQYDHTYRLLASGKANEFWGACGADKQGISQEFREVILSMLNINAGRRPTVEKLIESSWFKKPCLAKEVIVKSMSARRKSMH